MGVAGLFKDLLAYSSDVVVLDHRGKRTFRFDASWIIHQVVNAHYYEVIVLGDWTGYRKDVTALLMLIKKRYGAGKVSFCFDGLRLPGKLRNTAKTPFVLEVTRLFRKHQPHSCVARAHNKAARLIPCRPNLRWAAPTLASAMVPWTECPSAVTATSS